MKGAGVKSARQITGTQERRFTNRHALTLLDMNFVRFTRNLLTNVPPV